MQGVSRIVRMMIPVALLLLSGCASQNKSLYYWGEYQPMVYEMYAEPGKADPATQIVKIEEIIQQSENKGKKVPPGLYAHLGMMYAMQGDGAGAQHALQLEKQLYPESATLIDGMIQRANEGGQTNQGATAQ